MKELWITDAFEHMEIIPEPTIKESQKSFADIIFDTIWESFSKLPEDEQDRRIAAFERAYVKMKGK